MVDSCMTGVDCGATGSGTRIYPYCLHWLFGTHSVWMDTLFSLDIEGRALVLPQNNVVGFVDSLWEALPSLRSGSGMEWQGEGRGTIRRGKSGDWDLYVK